MSASSKVANDAMNKKRKVIQVMSSIDVVGKYLILAVCNDGTLWKLDGLYEGEPKWESFPTPPKE